MLLVGVGGGENGVEWVMGGVTVALSDVDLWTYV